MSTKKLQIIGGMNADTLDGKHADEFASYSDVETLKTQVGDTSVAEQIEEAISQIDLGSNVGQITEAGGEIFNDYDNNQASGNYSHAEGRYTTAAGTGSHAEGSGGYYEDGTLFTKTFEFDDPSGLGAQTFTVTGPYAYGGASHAEGLATLAYGSGAHAEGTETLAVGGRAHAEGTRTSALGHRSHTEGSETIATGIDTHAQGTAGQAIGRSAHVEGYNTNYAAEVIPYYDAATDGTTKDEIAANHKTKKYHLAYGRASHAEGVSNLSFGEGAHTEGKYTQALADRSHAEGYNTVASGNQSHAEGNANTASGDSAHAEGTTSVASGNYSHAEGGSVEAKGQYSHAEGWHTIAASSSQHVQGRYNIADTSTSLATKGKYAHIVGGGDKEDEYDNEGNLVTQNRKNIHTLDWKGNGWFAGKVTIGEDNLPLTTESTVNSLISTAIDNIDYTMVLQDYATESYVNDKAKNHYVVAGRKANTTAGERTTAEGKDTTASGYASHSEGYNTVANGRASHAEGGYSTTNALAEYAHAEGSSTVANGVASHTEGQGTIADGVAAHAEGISTKAEGQGSHAEGDAISRTSVGGSRLGPQALGRASHAEGTGTIAGVSGDMDTCASHAEGVGSQALATAAHAEGFDTVASGIYSHAEGDNTTASGSYAHAEGGSAFVSFSPKLYLSETADKDSTTFIFEKNSSSSSLVKGTVIGFSNSSNKYEINSTGITEEYTYQSNTIHIESCNLDTVKFFPPRGFPIDKLYKFKEYTDEYGNTYTINVTSVVDDLVIMSYRSKTPSGGIPISPKNPAFDINVGLPAGTWYIPEQIVVNIKTPLSSKINSSTEVLVYKETTASGEGSHAEGKGTVASGEGSHAEGICTKASGAAQHVSGRFNITDANNKYAHIIGNGTSSKQSNAYTLDWKGNGWFAGDVYTRGTNQNNAYKLATQNYVNTTIASIVDSAPETLNTLNELAAALGDDENFATTISTNIGNLEKKVGDTPVADQITTAIGQINKNPNAPLIVTVTPYGTNEEGVMIYTPSHTGVEITQYATNIGPVLLDCYGFDQPHVVGYANLTKIEEEVCYFDIWSQNKHIAAIVSTNEVWFEETKVALRTELDTRIPAPGPSAAALRILVADAEGNTSWVEITNAEDMIL